jgi:threonine/homoserine/homoserine lactone efflux protein
MSLALLLTPGPTNTLLFVGGAADGLKRSLWLPLAELLGYLAAIHILALSIGPFLQQAPVAQLALRLALSAYLAFLAVKLWITLDESADQRAVTPQRVFIVTLLNPKALVFAFVVLPPITLATWLAALPYLIGLSGLILGASLCWIAMGAALRARRIAAVTPQIVKRLGAAILLIFAAVIGFSALK